MQDHVFELTMYESMPSQLLINKSCVTTTEHVQTHGQLFVSFRFNFCLASTGLYQASNLVFVLDCWSVVDEEDNGYGAAKRPCHTCHAPMVSDSSIDCLVLGLQL